MCNIFIRLFTDYKLRLKSVNQVVFYVLIFYDKNGNGIFEYNVNYTFIFA